MGTPGFRYLTEHAERGLTAYRRRSVEVTFSSDALTDLARVWLYEHRDVLPGDKRIRLLVRAATRHAEHALCRRIGAQFNGEIVAGWIKELTAPKEGAATTVLEWLRDPPHRAGRCDIANSDHHARAIFSRAISLHWRQAEAIPPMPY